MSTRKHHGSARLSRRHFIGSTGIGLMVGGCAGQRWEAVEVPAAEGRVELAVERHPGLQQAGGELAVDPSGSRPVLVQRTGPDSVRVLSLRCTHLGCTVRRDPEQGDLVCPCHGSRFTEDGRVTRGPAKQPLPEIPSQFDGKTVVFSVED